MRESEPITEDPHEQGIELDWQLVGIGLLPQALNEWTVVSTMLDLAQTRTSYEEKQELANVLSDLKPVPYADYLASITKQSEHQKAVTISDMEAVREYDELVEKYNALAADISGDNLDDKIPKISAILTEAFGLFGEKWPPPDQTNLGELPEPPELAHGKMNENGLFVEAVAPWIPPLTYIRSKATIEQTGSDQYWINELKKERPTYLEYLQLAENRYANTRTTASTSDTSHKPSDEKGQGYVGFAQRVYDYSIQNYPLSVGRYDEYVAHYNEEARKENPDLEKLARIAQEAEGLFPNTQ